MGNWNIGREYAHLGLNHSGIRQQREQTRQGVSSVIGAILGAAGVPLGGTIADVATSAVSTVYTRDEERDADRVGLGYSKSAGYDPQGAVRAWERMMAVSGISIPFLSTHSTREERLTTMKEIAVTDKQTASPALAPATTVALAWPGGLFAQ